MLKALIIGIILIVLVFGVGLLNVRKPGSHPSVFPSPTPQISSNLPILLTPQPDATLTGPLIIKGYVPKNWTFEGQFRLQLLDNRRNIILADRVPVEWDAKNQKEILYFVSSYNYRTTASSGFLVLQNDNPSGLPENSKRIEIPVKFAAPLPGTAYLFLYSPAEDQKLSENPACQTVLPEAVSIGLSKTPLKDTLNLLAKRMHPDFYVKSLNLKNGLLTIEFPEINGFTTGGSCAQGINTTEVLKTAQQYSEVKEVKIIPATIFQP